MIGCLGRRMFGVTAGLGAALWLAFEPYHVHYSRLGLHETDSMFLMIAGVYAWQISKKSGERFPLFLCGLLLMLAIGTSYRLFPMFLIVCVYELYGSIKRQTGIGNTITRFFILISGAGIAYCFLDSAYRVIFTPHYLWAQPSSYWTILQNKMISETSMDLKYPEFYFQMFRQFDGWIPLLVLSVAILWTILRGDTDRRHVAFLFLIPFVLFGVTSTRLARTITGILPWGALAVGITFQDFLKHRFFEGHFRSRTAGTVFWIAILGSMILNVIPLYEIKSGYSDAIKFLKERNVNYHLTTMTPVYAFYLGRHAVDTPQYSLEQLQEQVNQTHARYLSVDWQKYLRYSPAIRKIEETVLPIFAVRNEVVKHFSTLHENHLPQDVEKLRAVDPTLHYIKIYDLYTALPSVGYPIDQLDENIRNVQLNPAHDENL